MAGSVDYQGIAQVITSLASLAGAVGVMISLYRGSKRDVKLDIIQKQGDGLTKIISEKSHELGVIEGGNKERAKPTKRK